MFTIALAAITVGASARTSQATNANPTQEKPAIAEIADLEAAGADILTSDRELGLGYAILTPEQELKLADIAHAKNKCGGFEALPFGPVDAKNPLIDNVFGEIKAQNAKNLRFHPTTEMFTSVQAQPDITAAVGEVSAANIQSTVEFLSSFPDREYQSETPNKHVEAMKARLEELVKSTNTTLPVTIEYVDHQRLAQKSLKVRILGAQRPNEVIVLGGHLDSINRNGGRAPGADDNASGSADLVEALRIVLSKKQPERTLEFFWYAGEEGGLLGSAEIARAYKGQNQNVVAVLQLDMTLYPGAGPMILGSMTDYTSAWLRSYLENINGIYIKAEIRNDKCGYGCSDHASWYRNGYPTLMPFESTFRGMNHSIHTEGDVISNTSNFEHAAIFAKIAVVMAMDLGNSTITEPK